MYYSGIYGKQQQQQAQYEQPAAPLQYQIPSNSTQFYQQQSKQVYSQQTYNQQQAVTANAVLLSSGRDRSRSRYSGGNQNQHLQQGRGFNSSHQFNHPPQQYSQQQPQQTFYGQSQYSNRPQSPADARTIAVN
jgi:hypothetical protein